MQQTDDFLLELYMQRFTTIEKKKKKNNVQKLRKKKAYLFFYCIITLLQIQGLPIFQSNAFILTRDVV